MQLKEMEWVDNRIILLSTAEQLAMSDDNPKNHEENMSMIARCVTAKIELYKIKLMTKRP